MFDDFVSGMMFVTILILAVLIIMFWGIIIPSWNRDIARWRKAESQLRVSVKIIERLRHDHKNNVSQILQMRWGYQRAHWRSFGTTLKMVLWVHEQGPEALERFVQAVAGELRPPWVLPTWLLDENWTPPNDTKAVK